MFPGTVKVISFLAAFTGLFIVGCSSTARWTFQEKLPTMAHIHIGHAITGWKDAPDEDGLFNTAEREAVIAQTQAQLAVQSAGDLAAMQQYIMGVMHAIDPELQPEGPGLGFGVKEGLDQATGHITYAGKSDDASENVRLFAETFPPRIQPVMDRCDLVLALGAEILASSSATDATILAEETLSLTKGILEGIDVNKDGYINLDSQELGLKQLRDDIDAVIAREEPPYATVAKRYLFGVIKLPDGKWAFSWLVDPFYDDTDGGGGGGY